MSENAQELLKRLGVDIDAETLHLALTHRSYAYENGGIAHNERLEFLGDAVLDLSVTDYLYTAYPEMSEGQLAKLRSAVVSAKALAKIARGLGIGEYVLLGHGELQSGGREKTSILADTTEALIGAVYVSAGPVVAAELVNRIFVPELKNAVADGAGTDWKTQVQEMAVSYALGPVAYKVTGSGPDHDRRFHAVLELDGIEYGQGSGRSKKEAEQQAAQIGAKAIQAQQGENA